MRRFLIPFALLLATSAVYAGQQTPKPQNTTPPPPKQKKPKKPKNYGYIVLLPIQDKTGGDAKQSQLEMLLARLGIKTAVEERGMTLLSPAETQVAGEQMHLDLGDPATWSMDNYKSLATNLKANFVFGATADVLTVKTDLDEKQSYPAHVELSTWAYSAKEDRMVREKAPFVSDQHVKGDRRKPISEQLIRITAIEQAMHDAFMKGILEKFKIVPPPEKKDTAHGGG